MGSISEHSHVVVVDAVSQGFTSQQIADKLSTLGVSVSRQRVQQHIKTHGIHRACKHCAGPVPYLPCKQLFCPGCRDISTHHELVGRLYVVECKSVGNITIALRDVGCFMSPGRVAEYIRAVKLTRMCVHCEQPLETLAMGNKLYCDTCAPDRSHVIVIQRYGLSRPKYEAMLKEQGHRCKVCHIDLKDVSSHLICVDHCHKTGQVRGIVCMTCNRRLGFLEKLMDEGLLERAIKHIQSVHE